jgi:ubiquitin-protein ligase
VNVSRIQQEVRQAKEHFAYLELHPTADGKVYLKAALSAQQVYTLSIKFPETYPNEMPRVFIDAPSIGSAPHRYNDGHICYLHPSVWNPGIHDIKFVIARAAKWLNKYEVWKHQGKWPGKEVKH